jgi:DNA-binding NtrC family response regulator
MTESTPSKIFIIEDEDSIRETMVELLKSLDYDVLSVNNVPAARQVIENDGTSIAVIICDVVLGNIHGPKLLQELNKYITHAAVIFTSGFNHSVIEEEIKNASALFLPKPFDMDDLKSTVEEAFGLARQKPIPR